MTNVVRAAERFLRRTQILLLLDLQHEHLHGPVLHRVSDADRVLHACRRLLESARQNGVRIAHARRVVSMGGRDRSPGVAWIEGCRPLANEMVCEHVAPSCYSNPVFASLLDHVYQPQLFVAGFGLNETGLATIIDGFSRNHALSLVRDASACHGVGARVGHRGVCELIGQFSSLLDEEATIASFNQQANHRNRRYA
jgi:nicotinamidase-related amidase